MTLNDLLNDLACVEWQMDIQNKYHLDRSILYQTWIDLIMTF